MHPRCDETAPWALLQAYFADDGQAFDLRQAFTQDAQRFAHFSQQAPLVFADLSKNLWDRNSEALLLAVAQACQLPAQRDALLTGQAVNHTEGRAALHTLLRRPAGQALTGDAPWVAQALEQVHTTLDALLGYAEQVRADAQITDIVNIGIGGSDLGPHMAVRALQPYHLPGKRFHFVSNIDGHGLQHILGQLQPRHTLFVVASKTFTTLETMTNARAALEWFQQHSTPEEAPVARHFVALTAHPEVAQAWGITRSFSFWEWVGGRYSLWSSIGLTLAIAIGSEGFRALLAGAHAMDEHFRTAPLAHNLPVRLALLDVWYRNFYGWGSRCITPYHSGLQRLPAYLQQLEMESNGKRVDHTGRPLTLDTSPVLWGEHGSSGQHAFYQMLHQGTQPQPLEIVAVRDGTHPHQEHHALLLASAVAQTQALMLGRASECGHRHFPGNRPSTFLLLDTLTPQALGALLALYEHRVFCSASLWGINPFDQWGVELGKQLAHDLRARLRTGDISGLDSSTAGLLQRLAGGAAHPTA